MTQEKINLELIKLIKEIVEYMKTQRETHNEIQKRLDKILFDELLYDD